MSKEEREKKLLLLNIDDIELNELFVGLQELFNKKRSKSLPHVTLRGPYNTSPSENMLKKLHDTLIENRTPLEISGVDIFDNDGLYIVYFKVFQKNIESLSWKKDYPKKQFGFNPHISIYKGRNKELAYKILNFLKKENLSFSCEKYSLDMHVLNSNQTKIRYESIRHADEVLKYDNNKYTYILKDAYKLVS